MSNPGETVADARNIALTVEATIAAEQIVERLRLAQRVDAVRLGIAYAIRHHVTLERENWGVVSGGGNYNIATVDLQDGTLRRLVPIFYEEEDAVLRPYHCLETLMNKGVLLLHKHLKDGTLGGFSDFGVQGQPAVPGPSPSSTMD